MSSVSQNSLASKAGFEIGDQVLEVNAWMDECMVGWMDVWLHECMDGWSDGACTNRYAALT